MQENSGSHIQRVTIHSLPPHMNLHLAKLHNHAFVRAIYGFEVKVFDNISGVEATKFPSQLEVYMCCRPRANIPYIFHFCLYT